jgi:hypothetical protein
MNLLFRTVFIYSDYYDLFYKVITIKFISQIIKNQSFSSSKYDAGPFHITFGTILIAGSDLISNFVTDFIKKS